jgi:hypothetical protein
MFVVKRGVVMHGGKNYCMGEVLPDMPRTDAERLVELGAAAEVAGKVPTAGAVNQAPGATEDKVDLNFSPNEAIKVKNERIQ